MLAKAGSRTDHRVSTLPRVIGQHVPGAWNALAPFDLQLRPRDSPEGMSGQPGIMAEHLHLQRYLHYLQRGTFRRDCSAQQRTASVDMSPAPGDSAVTTLLSFVLDSPLTDRISFSLWISPSSFPLRDSTFQF